MFCYWQEGSYLGDKKMICPKCDGILAEQLIFRYRDNCRHEVVGKNLFCQSMKCAYEIDL